MTKLEERVRKYTLNPFEKVEIEPFEKEPANKAGEARLANVGAVEAVKAEEDA